MIYLIDTTIHEYCSCKRNDPRFWKYKANPSRHHKTKKYLSQLGEYITTLNENERSSYHLWDVKDAHPNLIPVVTKISRCRKIRVYSFLFIKFVVYIIFNNNNFKSKCWGVGTILACSSITNYLNIVGTRFRNYSGYCVLTIII